MVPEAQDHFATRALFQGHRGKSAAELDEVSRLELSRRAREGRPNVVAQVSVQRDLDLGPAAAGIRAVTGEARRQNARIVGDEKVAGLKNLRQIAHVLVLKALADAQ